MSAPRFRVSPAGGLPTLVNFTRVSGGTVTAYSDEARTSPVSLPATITVDTVFYFASPGRYVPSVQVGGIELASGRDVPILDGTSGMFEVPTDGATMARITEGLDGAAFLTGTAAVGARLDIALLATGFNLSNLTTSYVDLTGFTIAPVIGARGVDVRLMLPVLQLSSSGFDLSFNIWDTTAGVQIGQTTIPCARAVAACSLIVPHSPAAGTRSYKAQVKTLSGTITTLGVFGLNVNATNSFLDCIQR